MNGLLILFLLYYGGGNNGFFGNGRSVGYCKKCDCDKKCDCGCEKNCDCGKKCGCDKKHDCGCENSRTDMLTPPNWIKSNYANGDNCDCED